VAATGEGGGAHGMLQAAANMVKLYKLFIERDATLVEINPMSELSNGKGRARARAPVAGPPPARAVHLTARGSGLCTRSHVHGCQDQH
jgi:hypothetical protein